MDPKEYKGANIFKDALDLNKKAMKIFEKKNKADAILSDIFSRIEKEKIKEKELSYLKEGIENIFMEIKGLGMLEDVYVLLGEYKEYESLSKNDIKGYIKKANDVIKNAGKLAEYLDKMEVCISKGNFHDNYMKKLNDLGFNSFDEFMKWYEGKQNKALFYSCSSAILVIISYLLLMRTGIGIGLDMYKDFDGFYNTICSFDLGLIWDSYMTEIVLFILSGMSHFVAKRNEKKSSIIENEIKDNAYLNLIYKFMGLQYSDDLDLENIYKRALSL